MSEVAQQLMLLGMHYLCEKCEKKPPVESTGTVRNADGKDGKPRMFEHRCPSCGAEYNLPQAYPYTKTMPVQQQPQTEEVIPGEEPLDNDGEPDEEAVNG